MTQSPEFDVRRTIAPATVERVAPLIRRICAGNAGPTTFTGTNTYIVGEGSVAVIDPGPADEAHLKILHEALAGETVSHILVTHTHRDHSPLARPLAEATGAPALAFSRHAAARPQIAGRVEAGGDTDFAPDRLLAHGERVEGNGWALEAVHTPGHTSNHLCFALAGTGALFSGDHVMGWSTTMVSPPDGDMASYFASLGVLAARGDEVYWPGHGHPIRSPGRYVAALANHRRAREAAILAALVDGPASAETVARAIYAGLAENLMRPATLTTLAHLIHLAEQGLAEAGGAPAIGTAFSRAG